MNTLLRLKKEIVISEEIKYKKERKKEAFLLATIRAEIERKQQIHKVRLGELNHAPSRRLAPLTKSHMAC
jgi:hypothetical protein